MFSIVSAKPSQRKSSTVVGNTNGDLALLSAYIGEMLSLDFPPDI